MNILMLDGLVLDRREIDGGAFLRETTLGSYRVIRGTSDNRFFPTPDPPLPSTSRTFSLVAYPPESQVRLNGAIELRAVYRHTPVVAVDFRSSVTRDDFYPALRQMLIQGPAVASAWALGVLFGDIDFTTAYAAIEKGPKLDADAWEDVARKNSYNGPVVDPPRVAIARAFATREQTPTHTLAKRLFHEYVSQRLHAQGVPAYRLGIRTTATADEQVASVLADIDDLFKDLADLGI